MSNNTRRIILTEKLPKGDDIETFVKQVQLAIRERRDVVIVVRGREFRLNLKRIEVE